MSRHTLGMAISATPVDLAYPDEAGGEPLELRIALGPCRVRIAAGRGPLWVSGRYEDPTGILPLQVTSEGRQGRVSQTPAARSVPSSARPPSLDLQLGTDRPYELVIDGGANETIADLGGVPLTRIVVHHGAGRTDLDFSSPNPAEMTAFEVTAGGVAMDLRNLANANFAELTVSGGAAQYRLDFGGELRRDGAVRLNAGVAAVELRLPATTPARVRSSSVLGALDVGDGFLTREGAYWNEAAAAGRTPHLDLQISSVLGAVSVRSI
jgi:hypothetical protein